MNQRQRFLRKVMYGCAMAALLLPVSWLAQPETTESKGGLLAQMRSEHQLSQANLGEIDPASETMKLAMLGMRGVAANILWEKAQHYRKVEDWAGLSATLEQIARLQPNFVSVWVFQGWNLSYNISVEFDDYRDRYYWVIRGINYLKEGTLYNKDDPRLLSEIGWTIGQKIGRADEHIQFRRLFRADDDFNGARPLAQRDNWLVAREEQLKAEKIVETTGIPAKGKSPLLFYSHGVMYLVNYAEAIEEEGTFGEVAKSAWNKAAAAWTAYSNRDLPTVYNFFIRLSEKEMYDKRAEEARAELDKLTPEGLRDKIAEEKRATLTEAEREAVDIPPTQRTREQQDVAGAAEGKLIINDLEVADRITGENHAAAVKAADDAVQFGSMAKAIGGERDIINYDYWIRRCQIEPEDDTLAARKLFYDGDRAYLAAKLVQSHDLYTDGLKKWRQVIDKHPVLLDDNNLTDELAESINHYLSVLHQLDEKLPRPFILQDVLDAHQRATGTKVELGDSEAEAKADGAASSSANDPSKQSP